MRKEVDPIDRMAISGELGVTKYFGDDSGRYVHDDGNIHETNGPLVA